MNLYGFSRKSRCRRKWLAGSLATPINSNRLASLQVCSATNLPSAAWENLTNALVLTNGEVRITNLDATLPQRYFNVREPN